MVSSRPVMPIRDGIVFIDALAVHAQALEARGERVVVGKDGAAVAIAAERLGREEARRGRGGERAELAALIGRAEGLRRVVEHQECCAAAIALIAS